LNDLALKYGTDKAYNLSWELVMKGKLHIIKKVLEEAHDLG